MTDRATGAPTTRSDVDNALVNGARAATVYGRPELAARLERRRVRLAASGVRVVVIGQFKAGKSSLVNAALGAALCPVDDAIATAVPTVVRHGSELTATGLVDADGEMERHTLAFDDRSDHICETGQGGHDFAAVELTVPRALLAEGLELIDTPGVGGLRSHHCAASIAAVEDAEAVLFVTDASQELSGHEISTLRDVADRCPNVLVILTKCDLFPEWRRIQQLDEEHLVRQGLEMPIVAVASPLRERAIELRDQTLNVESGYAELLTILRERIVANADSFAADQAVYELLQVVDLLVESLSTERALLADPAVAAAIEADLEAAGARAERFRTESAKWQTALNDGVTDLTADIDHDLRGRFRRIASEAGERIEEFDPRQSWDEFTPWLEQQVAEQLLANHHLLHERTDDLARRVLHHLQIDETEIAVPHLVADMASHDSDAELGELDVDTGSPLKQVLGGLRGSYTGLLMFGAFGGMAGIAIATPVLAGIGLLLGARQIRDERSKQLRAHRQQAQVSVRKYLDEVAFVAGKTTRDGVKLVQRNLRDHCTAQARELQERIRHNLAAVKEARDRADHSARIRDLDAELVRLATFRSKVEALCD